MFYIDSWNGDILGMDQLPKWYCFRIFYLFLGNSAAFLLYEKVFIQWLSKVCVEREQRQRKDILDGKVIN